MNSNTTSCKCPHCGKSHFVINYCITTAMYCPVVIKDGKVVSEDTNKTTSHCTCLECKKDFTC